MTIVFMCGDPVVNASILPFLYSDTRLPQLVCHRRSPQVLIRRTMTAQRYVHDILQPHVFSLMQRLPGAIFQQYNAQLHTARVSQSCLRTVNTLPWPALFPNLSPIEHIWDHLGRRGGHPTSLNELEARLQQIWNEISQDIIQNLYASMLDRIASCIRVRGGFIRNICLIGVICQTVYKQLIIFAVVHFSDKSEGCGSPVVKLSDHGRYVMSSSPVPLKTRREGQRCTLNLSRAKTSSRWCGVLVRRGGASSGVVHVT
ncbi:transposable element Tcb1 transposase [Trichonephila clavipes]|nr:transposable element Tcb1 transposase [Trichonephila clavipes]